MCQRNMKAQRNSERIFEEISRIFLIRKFLSINKETHKKIK